MNNKCTRNGLDILLSTYNGYLYLEELIASLKRQTCSAWNLIVRDDNSTDDTCLLMSELVKDIKNDVQSIEKSAIRVGPSESFSLLLKASKSSYSMFCDQDDIWLDDKIEVSLNAMYELERKYGCDQPLMVHTDLKVTNESLKVLDDSFWHYQDLNPSSANKLNRLLVQNVVTGCTVLINEPLKKLAIPIPDDVIMHDWWIALVACAFGHIGYVKTPTILYRQHSNNDTGAKKWDIIYAFQRLKNYYLIQDYIEKTIKQSQAFLEIYGHALSHSDLQIVSTYANIKNDRFYIRKIKALKYGFYEFKTLKNLGFILFV